MPARGFMAPSYSSLQRSAAFSDSCNSLDRRVANAENQRLRQDLQRELNFVRRDFNSQIAAAARALVPIAGDVEQQGRENAYLARYQSTPEATKRYFSRVALAVPDKGELNLVLLDSGGNTFLKAEWPLGWAKLHEGLDTRLSGGPPSERYRPEGVIEFPRFGRNPRDAEGERRPEQEWLILEFDCDYLRNVVLPSILQRYLAEAGQSQYSGGGEARRRIPGKRSIAGDQKPSRKVAVRTRG